MSQRPAHKFDAAGNGPSALSDFLACVRDETRRPINASHIAVVAAHPDDETIGCGALLARLKGARVIIVTDGAPRDLEDAERYGFTNASGYARARRAELTACLALAGIGPENLMELSIPDQEAATHLFEIAVRLAALFSEHGLQIVLTHGYEGGHPDHDAVAFAVHAARDLAGHAGQSVFIVEMPYYRAGDTGALRQCFAGDAGISVALTPAEIALKDRMLACHATQRETLRDFCRDVERFRSAPNYDFSELPNGGRLLYEAHDWKMGTDRWLALVQTASARLKEEANQWRSRS